jgi:hypothetical protein
VNGFQDEVSGAICFFPVQVTAEGLAHAPAMGLFGLGALVAFLGASGIQLTRRRTRRT